MKRTTHMTAAALLSLAGAGVPAWAMTLPSASQVQPMPVDGNAGLNAVESLTSVATGSATLVPLMAADQQAGSISTVDAPAMSPGGDTGKPVDDIAFVRQATESGRKEVASATEALTQLKQPELKRIAEMLVTDHSGANEKLSRIAEAKGWPIPAPATASAPPSGAASGDFDAKWTAEMIAGHERSVALYRAQAQAGEDKDLRKYARDTLPTIEHHLAELRRLQK